MEQLSPPPLEKKLPAPHEKLLRSPTFWEKQGKAAKWLAIGSIILFILIFTSAILLKSQKSTIIPAQPTQPPVSTTIPTTTSIPSNQAANWQTYKNEEYGFEFQYPKDYSRSPLETYAIERTAGDNKKYSGLNLGQSDSGCNFEFFTTETDKSINPFDETGFLVKAKEVVATKKIEYNKKAYHLGMSVVSHAVDSEKCISFFNQILSAFKFLDQAPS